MLKRGSATFIVILGNSLLMLVVGFVLSILIGRGIIPWGRGIICP